MLERAHACAFPRNDALMGAKKKKMGRKTL